MQAQLTTIKEQLLENNETILANLKCSLKVFIYREVLRPGLLVATDSRLIFIADSIKGNELNEIYDYDKVEDIKLKKGLINRSILIKYDKENVSFKHLMSADVEHFIEVIKCNLS
ncbi:PH domain-containing protein [Radiobacillus kanasensis]|uniref:PH domain-containing protein n=1 Tax=Radiobacillus kanasensis TaxID=2844358 RepID=UPI001E4B1EBD|nr:PH domain-containing protein [Radiobacillus kanasensis]UFU00124.1 PH domain-containing protein [Radiobacillus kanasensis]